MRQEATNMETGKRKISKSVIKAGWIFLILLAGLGVCRIYSSRLDYVLSEISRKIEARSTEEMELWQAFSGLTSPIKVYSYCKDKLGMGSPKNVQVIRVQGPKIAVVPPPNPKGWRSQMLSFFGFPVN
jgi:hypothetical protein